MILKTFRDAGDRFVATVEATLAVPERYTGSVSLAANPQQYVCGCTHEHRSVDAAERCMRHMLQVAIKEWRR